MLIEFRITNYRSFRETQVLSLVAGKASEQLESHTFAVEPPAFGRLLRSAGIYGPNAAGKTNLLKALQFMQSLVLSPPAQGVALSHTPFRFGDQAKDQLGKFEIAFIQTETRYEYGFEISAERVHREWLFAYPRGKPRLIFERQTDRESGKETWAFGPSFRGRRSLWSESTRPNKLFLSNAVELNSEQLRPVFDWFQRRLVVIVGATKLNASLTLRLLDQTDGKSKLLPFLREADFGITDLDIQREPLAPGTIALASPLIIDQPSPNSPPSLVRITFSHSTSESKQSVALDMADESNGTQAFFYAAGPWLNVLANGEVLLIDEIDTSLHPILTRFLIRQFHSKMINQKNAQLIFTTHNTALLGQDLLRRDQIYFVDKGRDMVSRLYPLVEFSPRKDESIERGYLRGRYGALPILDDFKI